jgi:hypothetical protein
MSSFDQGTVSGLAKIEMSDSPGRAARPGSLHFGRGFHVLQSFECLGNGPSHGNILSHFGFIYTEEPTLRAAPFESGSPPLTGARATKSGPFWQELLVGFRPFMMVIDLSVSIVYGNSTCP